MSVLRRAKGCASGCQSPDPARTASQREFVIQVNCHTDDASPSRLDLYVVACIGALSSCSRPLKISICLIQARRSSSDYHAAEKCG